ncbi:MULTISPECIES: phosphopantetheine-binding protein [Streptomyces]|uniref:Acyl carrier protein n=1 Tax=Streptomyces xanthii TaxID=2768069 RepID=A0A7H1BKB9_9ACTN|nr:phosphopantetheine-binding protein [Streptomyces xanthii]QNS09174.1 acyl carrier protein [Streptomyces xanthii]
MTAPVAADPATVRSVLVEVIAEILPDVPAQEVLDERSLADLGADSVDRVEIITTLCHRLGSRERVSRFAEIRDIGGLIAHLSGQGGAR